MTIRQAALAAGLLAVAVAAPSIRNGFVADDRWVIAERPLLQHPPSLAAVLQEPYWPTGFGGALWRPVVLASYALDYRLGGSPHWFHAVNVLWAGLATALLTLLACRLSDPVTGLVAGLLFAVHPVHVEAVANVVGRAELMAAAGYATALLCALSVERRPVYVIGVALGAAFAIGCKELAATLPAAVLLIYVGRGGGVGAGVRAALRPAAAALLPILGYYVVHAWVGAGILSAGGTASGQERLDVAQRAWAMLPLSVEWWRLLLWPAHLSADYSPGDYTVSTGLTVWHLAGALVWAAAGWSAWHWRKTVPGVAIGIAWMIVTVSPVANIVVPTELLVAERTLYLPSFGIAFALASAGMALRWPARRRIALLAIVLAAGAVRSLARVSVWHDDEAHFQALKRDAPHSYRTLWMVGKDEFQAGRWGSGERLLREAIELAPAIAGPRLDLARFYWDAGLWRPAAEQLSGATAVDSGFVPAWTLLPRALLAAGDTAGARVAARAALRRFPDEPDVVASATAGLAASGRPPPRAAPAGPGGGGAPGGGAPLDVLFFEQIEEFGRGLELGEAIGHVRLLGELGDLAEDGEVLVRHFEWRGDDQEEIVHRLVVDGLEVDPFEPAAEGAAQPIHHQRAAVGDRDALPDARRSEGLAALEHLEQHPLGLLIEME